MGVMPNQRLALDEHLTFGKDHAIVVNNEMILFGFMYG